MRSVHSRRDVLGWIAAAALPTFGGAARAAGGTTVTPVGDGLSLIGGAGGNVLVLSTPVGQVLVDSGAAGSTEALLATLGELPGERVAAVINTHWHPDQIGANAALGSAGATIYAHERTRLKLESGYYLRDEDRYRPPLPREGLPTETFYTEDAATIGGRRIELGYLVLAHTDADIFVALPELDVIAVGDVLAPARDPVFDWFGGGWVGGRVDSLALLIERSTATTRFVPAYGPVVGRDELEREHALMTAIYDRMVEHVRLGETAEDMLDAGVLDGLGRKFDDPYRLLYDMHKGFWAHHNKLMPDIV